LKLGGKSHYEIKSMLMTEEVLQMSSH